MRGITCHSSISRGGFPFKNSEGFVFARRMFDSRVLSSCMNTVLLANCSAVVDFPHHLGPFIHTAPLLFNLKSSISSTILLIYFFFIWPPYLAQYHRNLHIKFVRWFVPSLFGELYRIYSVVCTERPYRKTNRNRHPIETKDFGQRRHVEKEGTAPVKRA